MADRTLPGKNFKSNSLAASSNTPIVGRTTAMASLQQQANKQQAHLAVATPAPAFPKLKAFLSSYIWPWIKSYFHNIFKRKYRPYPNYLNSPHDNGIYDLRPSKPNRPIRIGIAGDWGTGTFESYEIGRAMKALKPDYTIHLGDVYYVGDQPEVDENFLGVQIGLYTPIKWPTGEIGEFALIGNHEMYGGGEPPPPPKPGEPAFLSLRRTRPIPTMRGEPYFTSILPTMRTGTGQHQKASFFALETDHWRIIALDTGYNSVGLPILGAIPGINKIPFVGANCRLEDSLIRWLRDIVDPRNKRKPTLILSHHQYFTAFKEDTSTVPADQLSEFFHDQEVIWIWAHEHRLAIYDKYCLPNQKIVAYGRCLGNGGMPCGKDDPIGPAPLQYYDKRFDYPLDDKSCAGWNGFLDLSLDGPNMHLRYLDVQNNLLYTESFAGTPGGGIHLTAHAVGPDPLPYRAPDLLN